MPAIETRLYRFDGAAGDRLYFDKLEVLGDNASVRLFDPQGQVLWGPQWVIDDRDAFALPRDGVHTMAVEGRICNGGPGSFRFNLQSVPTAATP